MGNAKNNSTPSILYAQPGLLNELKVAPDQPVINKEESIYSILAKTIDRVFSPDMLRNSGDFAGILLRVEDADTAPRSKAEDGAQASGAIEKPRTKYKVRIPELHFHLKVPNSLAKPTNDDNLIIDTYPTFTAKDDTIATQFTAGQLVRVKFDNNNSLEEGTFLGASSITLPWVNNHEDPVEDQLANSAKSYNGCGSTGDNYLTNAKPPYRIDTKLPIVFEGKGHGKVEIIRGQNAKDWVVDDIKKLQKRQSFQGKVYIDRFSSNGRLDDANMKDGIGRSTIIYMPATCTPAQPLELIYWFHDGKEFKREEWEKRLAPQLKAMTEGCRNFIFVEHEMLWSLENANTFNGVRRLQTTATDSPNWSDREWNIWGGPGAGPKPASYRGPGYDTWRTYESGGDLLELHNEVLKVLKNKFNVYPDKIAELTMIGHGSGGAAISVAARRGLIGPGQNQINPTKIVLSNASYSSTPGFHHLDSDIFEVFKILEEQTKLEIHTMWHTGGPRLPIEAAATFFGGLFDSLAQAGPNSTNFYAVKNIFTGAHTGKEIAEWSENGLKVIEEYKDSFFKAGPPFTNIIYKGWRNTAPSAGAKLTLKWLPPDEKGIIKEIKSTDPTQNSFMGFKGDAIEYNSAYNKGRKVVILKPTGVDEHDSFELVYFFHGQYGSIEKSFTKDMQNAISYMVEDQNRNIIVVMMDLGPKPDTGLAWNGAPDNNFNAFHDQVVERIEGSLIMGALPKALIEFITLKAFDTGGAAARRAIKNMTSQVKNKLQRIDFLEASYGYEDAIINNVNDDYNLELGNEVEFILIANPDFRKEEGDNSPWNRIKQYEGEDGPHGIIAIESNLPHKKIPSSYFSLKSILFPGNAPIASWGNTPQQETPALIYDEKGKAFNPLTLEPMPQYDTPITVILQQLSENQLPCPIAPGGYKESANELVRGYGFLKSVKFLPLIKKRIALEDKYTAAGKIKSYGSHTTSKLYNEHIKQQLDIAKKQHLSIPSLQEEKPYHKGANNIIWKGEPFLTETPFKVIRYDGTVPGYKRMIGERKGTIKFAGFVGPKITNKYWFDWSTYIKEDPSNPSVYSSMKRALQFLDNGEYFRSKKQITHITFHNSGGKTVNFKQRSAMFALKGDIAHFCIDEFGQIYQVCDAAAITKHTSGSPLTPATNPNVSSIAIEFLAGTDTPWANKRYRNNSLNNVLKELGYGGVDNWSEYGKTPIISAPSATRSNKHSFNKGKPYTTYYHTYRSHNADYWGHPTVHPAGSRAQHEAAYQLIEFLKNEVGCTIGSLAAVDARLDYSAMGDTGIQAHYQLQNNRIDGMSYIWWAWSQGKHKEISNQYVENPAPPDHSTIMRASYELWADLTKSDKEGVFAAFELAKGEIL